MQEEQNKEEQKEKWVVPKRKSSKTKKQRDTYKINLTPEFYNQYRARKKDLGEVDTTVTNIQFRKVVAKLLELVALKMLTEGFIFHIPYGCGAIRINKTKHKVRAKKFNDNLAVKAWDYTYRFVWDKTLAYFADMDLRIFYPSRKLRELKKDRILEANEDPMTKDIIGYASNSEIKDLKALYVLRKKTKKLKTADQVFGPRKEENKKDDEV